MTPEERAAVAALLASERERAEATEAGLAAELRAVVEASDQANLDDEHDPEGATVGYERARVASLLEEARSRLVRLDEAGHRLQAGTYGRCDVCGRPIDVERLSAHPTAATCVGCAPSAGRPPLRPTRS